MKKSSKESIMLARHISIFLDGYAPAHLTTSSNTLKSYRMAVTLYITFLEDKENISCHTLSKKCFERSGIEKWMDWLKEDRGCSNATCNIRLGALRAFLGYLGRQSPEYLYLAQEASHIPLRKTTKKKVNGLTKEAVKTLLETPDPTVRSGKQYLTMMVILYGTAARIDEVLSLRMEHVHLDGGRPYITVIGKGEKIRTLYLLPRAVSHIRQYIKEFHGTNPVGNAYLFYSRNGGMNKKLTQKAVSKALKKYAAIAQERCQDVPLTLSAHQFRHARATHWLEEGLNIVQISYLLGHESVETTMKYLDITNEDKMKALSTLEDENEKKISPKWKEKGNSLKSFCGLENKKV